MQKESETRDLAIFHILANELPGDDPVATSVKIKRKLKRAHLGDYDQAQVDRLRQLHNALKDEICKFDRSKYYRATPGGFAAPEHFDTERMVRDYLLEYPSMAEQDLSRIVGYSVYLFYLR